MNPAPDWLSLLAEWRRLTELESEAILQDDWQNVAALQQRKTELQTAITAARPLAAGPADKLPALVAELIALETSNWEVLAGKQERQRAELEHVNETSRNLRGVRRSYGDSPAPRWHSYS